jgi:predicted 3-demethylubiquinone-9 3-methyltransferase (glyoxalase superfamily)
VRAPRLPSELGGRIADGGTEGECGWLRDRYGLSWQIIPSALHALLGDPDPGRAQPATTAMRSMKKIDIRALKDAVRQERLRYCRIMGA